MHPRTHFLLPSFRCVFCCIECYSVYTLVLLTWYLNDYIFIKLKGQFTAIFSYRSEFCLLPLTLPSLHFEQIPYCMSFYWFAGRRREKFSLLLIPVAFIYLQLLTRTLGTRFSVSVRATPMPLGSRLCVFKYPSCLCLLAVPVYFC